VTTGFSHDLLLLCTTRLQSRKRRNSSRFCGAQALQHEAIHADALPAGFLLEVRQLSLAQAAHAEGC
jgi:hypothetical protein